jgi:hypothetical protein
VQTPTTAGRFFMICLLVSIVRAAWRFLKAFSVSGADGIAARA